MKYGFNCFDIVQNFFGTPQLHKYPNLFVILIDDEEDEEDEAYYTDAFDGMKQRMTTLNGKTDKMEKVRCKIEVDSYWVIHMICKNKQGHKWHIFFF